MSINLNVTLKGGLKKALDDILLPNEKVIASLEGLTGQGIALTDTRVIIVKAGLSAGAMFGQKGKAYKLKDISSVEYSCALTEGRVQVTVAGSNEHIHGWAQKGSYIDKVAASRQAENICQFPSNRKKGFHALSQMIQKAHDEAVTKVAAVSSRSAQPSIPDQIRQLGELLAQGILTQDEFDSKKKELLARL